MRKLSDLRQYLLSCPLDIPADKLLTFAEGGRLTSYAGMAHQNSNIALSYTAHCVVTDYAGDHLQLLFLVSRWLDQAEPGHVPDALAFHVDILDHQTADISVKIPLTESIDVKQEAAGTWLTPMPDADVRAFQLFP